MAEAFDEPAQVDDVLSRLEERDDLRLAGGEGDALLLARAPGEHGTLPKHTIHPLLGDNARFNDGGARCSVTPWLCHVTDTFDANDQLSVTFVQAHPEVFTFVQSGLWSRGAPGEHIWGQVPGTDQRAYGDTQHLWEDMAEAYLAPYFCSAFNGWVFYPGVARTINASYVVYNRQFEGSEPV